MLCRRVNVPCALSLLSTLRINKELWGCHQLVSKCDLKKKERERERKQAFTEIQRGAPGPRSDCSLGSHSWKEFTVGLSWLLTYYQRHGLHTVITFWPAFCCANALTTQQFPSLRCLKKKKERKKNPNHLWNNIWEHINISSPDNRVSKAPLMCSLFGGKIKDISWQVDSLDARLDKSGITCRWIITGIGPLPVE